MVTSELALLREVCLSRNTLRCGIQASAEALKATRWTSVVIPFILDFFGYKTEQGNRANLRSFAEVWLGEDDGFI
jgi:hypothetical protein